MDQELLVRIIEIVVLALVGILAVGAKGLVSVGVKYLESKIGSDQFESAKSIISTVVRAIEQSPQYEDLLGSEKKEQVILRASQWLRDSGLNVSDELLDQLIEEAVQVMKSEYGEGIILNELEPENS